MFRFATKAPFLSGISVGILLAVTIKSSIKTKSELPESTPRLFDSSRYQKWFDEAKLTRRPLSFDLLRYGNKTFLQESKYLYDRVTVLCVLLVKSEKNADAVKGTWGRHCNKLQRVNITSEKKKIPIKRTDEDSSWVILCKVIKEVPEEFKWILIVYDNTFVLLENLRLFVASLNYNDKYYLGHSVKFWSTIYNMGQAGYILSKGAVDTFKKKFSENDSCSKMMVYRNQEDFYLGKNLAAVNISAADTRDAEGFSTFHPYNLYQQFFPDDKHHKLSVYPHKCCSPHTISFQSIEGDKMYTYYYLLYTVQLFHGGHFGNRPSNQADDDQIWKTFLRNRNISESVSPEQYYKIWVNIVDEPTSFAQHMKREEYFDDLL